MGQGAIPAAQAVLYHDVILAARARGLAFAVGGAFGFGAYTGHWRNTKDLDLYIRPQDREPMIALLTGLGFRDYYDQLPYDRRWIYRGFREGAIVDAIWAMANQRAEIDEKWLSGGREIELGGERVRALPVEELIWAKLYVVQPDRCDWQDIMNLLAAAGETLDWSHLLEQVGPDAPVLRGVLSLFQWIAPGLAARFPAWLWGRIGLPAPASASPDIDRHNVALLDSRPWFRI